MCSPEEASVFHVVCVLVVLLLRTNSHPEEVLWLLPLIDDLGDKRGREFDKHHQNGKQLFPCKAQVDSCLCYLFTVRVVKHAVHDVLGQFGLVWVGGSANPRVNDALIVGALEWYLEKTQAVISLERSCRRSTQQQNVCVSHLVKVAFLI